MNKGSKKLISYQEKTVFVEMDVHKKHYSLSCIFEGEFVKKATVKASPEKLVEFLKKYFPEAKVKSAYEVGLCGFFLHKRNFESDLKISIHKSTRLNYLNIHNAGYI